MRTAKKAVLQIAFLLLASAAFTAFGATSGPRLTLPPAIYAVPGVEVSLYFSNAVLTASDDVLSFAAKCAIGESDARRWRLNATEKQVGDHPLTLLVRDSSGRTAGQGTTTVRVVPADAGRGKDIALLIVGDSLTHASAYPNEIARLLSRPGNPKWQMLGTHKPSGVATNVAHEGYGGWTWRAFNSRFDPKHPVPGKTNSSPFVFAVGEKQTPALDVTRFISERCGGRAPDFVTFLLGINDCFRLKADDPKALDMGIADMFKEADKLLAEFHKAAPRAQLGVCLTTPPNDRDAAFVANYKANYPRWNWKQIQHRIVERQLEHFAGRERENIFIVPTELNLDTFGGYPDNNAVHPNPAGYQQIGTTIYSWLKARFVVEK